MSNIAKVAGAAANTLTTPPNVEDVFSTYLYEGNAPASQTITNGIDLSGEGGLVWIKNRNTTYAHMLHDTEATGVQNVLRLPSSNGIGFDADSLTSFNSDGFTIGADAEVNESGSSIKEFVSWTFRKAPKFFTIVTYTGDGTTNRQISHDLGGTVGHIAVKKTSNSAEWFNWHRTFSDNQLVAFTGTYAVGTYSNYLVTADSTTFTVGNNVDVNGSGETYVAYLWGHNDGDGDFGPTGDQDIIKCGSYTGTGSTRNDINLGFEPQWLLIKKTSSTGNWWLFDNMRGLPTFRVNSPPLWANSSNAESTIGVTDWVSSYANGFSSEQTSFINNSGETFIYIAIRRGPMAVPTSATDVFDVNLNSWADSSGLINSSITPDTWITTRRTASGYGFYVMSRMTGGKFLETWTTDAEGASAASFDLHDGVVDELLYSSSTTNLLNYFWKRAPNYFDVVTYTGTGSDRTLSHNLGVAPEMIWVKDRGNAGYDWMVYHTGLNGGTNPEQYWIKINGTNENFNTGDPWNDTAPTSSVFSVGADLNTNRSGHTYIAYLFASLAGVSKVGSASHTTGSNTDVDCGFSAGARFVILKGIHASGWQVFDTERGIVTGNDPKLTLHSSAAEGSSQDSIDPYSSGFSIGPDIATGTYIFYAIA